MSLEKYKALEDKEARERYRSTEHLAYHQIVTALQSRNPVQALQARIQQEQMSLAEKEEMYREGRYIGNPERYRTYYNRMIELFRQALNEL